MSRAFRTTFTETLCGACGRRGGSLPRTPDAHLLPAATTQKQYITNTDHHHPGHAGRISSRRTPTTCRLAADTAN